MQDQVMSVLSSLSNIVWGPPLLLLLVGTGFFFTFRLRAIQLTKLTHALKLAFIKRHGDDEEPGDISHFQALMTAMAATVGTGNIAGVATAIAAGGPGALFWMWVTGFVGMATKYAEAVLAVKYRVQNENGSFSGGPMYYLSLGLKQKWLGVAFAGFAALAAFGIGNMAQSNSVADALYASFKLPPLITGFVLTVATGLVILGGVKWIGRVASAIVPFMIVIYGFSAIIIVIIFITKVPSVFALIFESAFTGHAAVGGFSGAIMKEAVRWGVARGVFSNESGLGSSPIAAAAAKTKDPVTQALISMTQTFIDTIVVCTLTGLAILLTGVWENGGTGAALTVEAFSMGLPGNVGGAVVTIGLVFFAYSTLLGWSYYGEKCIEFLFGRSSILPYRVIFVSAIYIGAVIKLDIVWAFSDVANGMMAIPNLIGLLGLSSVVVSETKAFLAKQT